MQQRLNIAKIHLALQEQGRSDRSEAISCW
jgi:hypothetical protein